MWIQGTLTTKNLNIIVENGMTEKRTIIDWFNFIRDICKSFVKNTPSQRYCQWVNLGRNFFGNNKEISRENGKPWALVNASWRETKLPPTPRVRRPSGSPVLKYSMLLKKLPLSMTPRFFALAPRSLFMVGTHLVFLVSQPANDQKCCKFSFWIRVFR